MNKLLIFFILFFTLPAFAINIEFKVNKDTCESLQHIDNTKLSNEERNGLIHMRIEEKLARDVYIALGEIWSERIFQNIQKSEQRHMNAMKRLIDYYNIPDPVEIDEIGIFSAIEFQKLYDELVEKGSKSFQDAMLVGVAIEELDISDLEIQLGLTDNSDIKNVYENLKEASKRHLNAFNRHIVKE